MDRPPAFPGEGRSPLQGKVGRYIVQGSIGHGGMGEVYRATDPLLRQPVALKRVASRESHSEEQRDRILREARGTRRVTDPRIASLYDVLEHDGEIILVLEYVEGKSLREQITEDMPLERFWEIALPCVEALAVAHRARVLHLDIKPENIMVSSSGQLKILDFGLAKLLPKEGSPDSLTTMSTDVRKAGGTPHYMSPEAHLGNPVDERSDIFSLGVLFFELLAGRRPFPGTTLGALTEQILHVDPEPLSAIRADVPPSLSRIVLKMLAKDPAERYSSAEALLSDLRSVSQGEEVRVSLPSPAGPGRRRIGGRVFALAGVGIGVAVVLLLAFGIGPGEWVRLKLGLNALPDQKHVALLPIRAAGNDAKLAHLAMGATRKLHEGLTRLTKEHALQVSPRRGAGGESVASRREAREILGADLVLDVYLIEKDRRLEGDVRILDAASGRPLREDGFHVPASDWGGLLKSALATAAGMLGMESEDLDADHLLDFGTEGAGTFARYLRGLGYLEAASGPEEIQKAIDELELACNSDPEDAASRAATAEAFLQMYEATRDTSWLMRGEETARTAVALDTARFEARKVLAKTLWSRGDPEEAVREMRRALALDPTDDEAALLLGRYHGRRGLIEEQEAIFRSAVETRPHYWRPYTWLARYSYTQGRIDDAIDAYIEVIRRAPSLYVGYESLGGLYVLEGDYERAVETLDKAIRLNPTRVGLTNLGTAHFNLREFDAAIETYNLVLSGPFTYAAWLNLGDAYYYSPGKKALAGDAYRHAVRLAREELEERPYDVQILADLAQIYPKIGLPDSARACVERALESDPQNPMIHYAASLTYWELGRRETALGWLERAVSGGYPAAWLRDSPMFDEWREEERFQSIIGTGTSGGPGPEITSQEGG